MSDRPILTKELDSTTFRNYYYLKEELRAFCKANKLPTTGSKIEITDRIAHFLDTGEIVFAKVKAQAKVIITDITEDLEIEANFVCSEVHRAFFKKHIGVSFSFNVAFQNWLKENTEKTYREAIDAYHQILADKKKGKTTIGKQFEYNTYIRDFFDDNQGASLDMAIQSWNYKKALQGHNRYEKEDLNTLQK